MLEILKERILRQGYRTGKFPYAPPNLPERFLGLPALKPCGKTGCDLCVKKCPVGCLKTENGKPSLDLGKCLFCGECAKVCPSKSITFTKNHRLGSSSREGLVLTPDSKEPEITLNPKLRSLYGCSFKIRQVSAGGCAACELDFNVLHTLAWDIARFGIQAVASPRHADGILITGPVTNNMRLGLQKTFDAIPDPKIVIAAGACAISGGLYAEREETFSGVPAPLKVDLYIPGCPPHPSTILDALLRLLGRIN